MKSKHRQLTNERKKELNQIGQRLGRWSSYFKALGELTYRHSIGDKTKDDVLNEKIKIYRNRLNDFDV